MQYYLGVLGEGIIEKVKLEPRLKEGLKEVRELALETSEGGIFQVERRAGGNAEMERKKKR